MAIVFQCDICGKLQSLTANGRRVRIEDPEAHRRDYKVDICVACTEKILEFINKMEVDNDESETEETEEVAK